MDSHELLTLVKDMRQRLAVYEADAALKTERIQALERRIQALEGRPEAALVTNGELHQSWRAEAQTAQEDVMYETSSACTSMNHFDERTNRARTPEAANKSGMTHVRTGAIQQFFFADAEMSARMGVVFDLLKPPSKRAVIVAGTTNIGRTIRSALRHRINANVGISEQLMPVRWVQYIIETFHSSEKRQVLICTKIDSLNDINLREVTLMIQFGLPLAAPEYSRCIEHYERLGGKLVVVYICEPGEVGRLKDIELACNTEILPLAPVTFDLINQGDIS